MLSLCYGAYWKFAIRMSHLPSIEFSPLHHLMKLSKHSNGLYTPLPIYIKKNVCLSVCMFFMHLDTVRANATKLFRNPHLIQEKVSSHFFPKRVVPPPAKSMPMWLTNQIAAFSSVKELLSSTS